MRELQELIQDRITMRSFLAATGLSFAIALIGWVIVQ